MTICGPMAAEALGLLEQPKRPSRFPAFLAGTVAGATGKVVAHVLPPVDVDLPPAAGCLG